MKRRTFLKLLGVAAAPLAGIPLGAKSRAGIELTYKGKPVSERLEIDFHYDSCMAVTFWLDDALSCDGVSLWRDGDTEPFLQRGFEPIFLTPGNALTVDWVVADRLSVAEVMARRADPVKLLKDHWSKH